MEDHKSIKRRVVTNNAGLTSIPKSQLNYARTKIQRKKRDFLKRINYFNTFSVVVLPALVLLYFFICRQSIEWPKSETVIFSFLYFNVTLLAFTAGYHKYFTHNSFQTESLTLQWFFAVFGSSLGLGSVRWWAALHRAHHQYTDDTERDPYSIKRGVFWAHWGWLIKKPKGLTFYREFVELEFPSNPEASTGSASIEGEVVNGADVDFNEIFEESEIDLSNLPTPNHLLINWQETCYIPLFMASTFLVPLLFNYFIIRDSITNTLIYPAVIRMFFAQQCILSTESLCHKPYVFLIPTQPFNDKNSSRNLHNPLLTILTYGQANQNYHHEFPHDYRNSSSYLAYDPTKWFIWTLYKLGIISDICKTPKDLITQLRIQQQQTVINRTKSQLNWGTPISKLPRITPNDFKRILASSNHNNDRIYIVIQDIIHDITPFMDQHPGGVQLLKASHGKDATKAFFGGVYGHLTAAINLLATMRIGILDVGNEEEVWRRVVKEEGILQDDRQGTGSGSGSQYKTAEAA